MAFDWRLRSNGRPTSIQVGAYGSVTQPSWSSCGAAAAAAPGAPPADGTTDSVTRAWGFKYDAHLAELTTLTEPNNLTTTFLYTNYPGLGYQGGSVHPRGVSEVDAVDASSNKQDLRWTRTYTSSATPTLTTVKVEGPWNPSFMPSPDRYHLITFPTDTLNYSNGVYQIDALMDTNGKTWRTTKNAFLVNGAGVDGSLSWRPTISRPHHGQLHFPIDLGLLV